MIENESKNKAPIYFGVFIVCAMLPQIVGFNGSVVDNAFKFVLIGILTILMVERDHIRKVSPYFCFFVLVSFIRGIATIIWNEAGIGSEIQSWIIEVLLVYIFYECVLHIQKIRKADIILFYKIFVYFMLIAAIYNMIVHFNSLLHITSLSVYNTDAICSFFDNKNTYGVFLLFGSLAAIILKILLGQQRWAIIAIIFVVNEMMAMCRTALVLSLILIIVSFIIDPNTRVQGIIVLIISLVTVGILINKNASINNFFVNTLFGNSKSLEARNDYVTNMLPLSRGMHFWIGYGNEKARTLAVQYTGNMYYHNTYLKCLMSGGIVKLVLQISAIFLSLKYGLKNRLYSKKIGNLCLLSTVIYIIYAFVESVILFDTPVVAITIVILIISMPILFYNTLIYEDLNNGESYETI